jgi:potassium/hydrogen antiporter
MNELTSTALLLAVFGLLMAASVVSSRTIERLGVPVVLVFLLLGMLAGSEGVGGIAFEDYQFAFRAGTAALVLILLDAGFNTPTASLRRGLGPAAVLATVGVAGTAALVAGFAWLLGMSKGESLLLGAVVSSTDAAAVFAVLRGGNLRLSQRVGAVIEMESGMNDPMAVILTVAVTSILGGEAVSRSRLLLAVPVQLAVGVGIGFLVGTAARMMLQRMRLATAGLYPVLTLALGFFAFGITTLAHGSGFLAVYVFAATVGNSAIPYRNGLIRIHDAVAWLSQVSMFLMLGLLAFPSQLRPVAGSGLLIGLFLALAARPVMVAVCLLPFRLPWREIVYVGCVGLRGAVPIILASFPVLMGVQGATKVLNIVFFVVVFNSLLPGAMIRFLTRRLEMESSEVPAPLAALEINSTRLLSGELASFFISEPLAVCNVAIARIPFPEHCSAVLVVRGEELIAPRGSTVLRPGDHVYVFCRPEDKPFIQFLFGRPQEHG